MSSDQQWISICNRTKWNTLVLATAGLLTFSGISAEYYYLSLTHSPIDVPNTPRLSLPYAGTQLFSGFIPLNIDTVIGSHFYPNNTNRWILKCTDFVFPFCRCVFRLATLICVELCLLSFRKSYAASLCLSNIFSSVRKIWGNESRTNGKEVSIYYWVSFVWLSHRLHSAVCKCAISHANDTSHALISRAKNESANEIEKCTKALFWFRYCYYCRHTFFPLV